MEKGCCWTGEKGITSDETSDWIGKGLLFRMRKCSGFR